MNETKTKVMHRFNTRITDEQRKFIKQEVKKSKNALTEGEVTRALLDEAISNRNKK